MTTEHAVLLAVADAARGLLMWRPDRMTQSAEASYAWGRLETALYRAPSYRAQPKVDEPKTVEVRAVVIMSPCGRNWTVMGADVWDDGDAERMASEYARTGEVRAAVIVAHVMPPTTPVVTGSVEP